MKRRKETSQYLKTAESYGDTEFAAAKGEESVSMVVTFHLPEERRRIRELLDRFPKGIETKTKVLLNALNQFWKLNPDEKIVIFTTYLGSVDVLSSGINEAFPGKGVEILKGGDHGSKIAAQKRFKRKDGPRVLICTAAGREGINLQFARILFNYDLPWNPMDLEQRIGRIHRYGQKYTAQVYNLVATDTIEGQIFLLLEEKLQGIAETLGKVDEQGQVAEDLRSQVLGQLSSRLSYDRLYQEAIQDPTLNRTKEEIEVAMTNANLAREVVFELFQDLEKFNLGDYKRIDDEGRGMARLIKFVQRAAGLDGGEFQNQGEDRYDLERPDQEAMTFTSDRDKALQEETLQLLGLEHPVVKAFRDQYDNLPPEDRAFIGKIEGRDQGSGLLTVWHVVVHAPGGQVHQKIFNLGMTQEGERSPLLERQASDILKFIPVSGKSSFDRDQLHALINGNASELLHRELQYSGILSEGASYSSRLLACIEIVS